MMMTYQNGVIITNIVFLLNLMENYYSVILKNMHTGSLMYFTLLHSEWPKLYGVLAILSAKGLRYMGTLSGEATLSFHFYLDPHYKKLWSTEENRESQNCLPLKKMAEIHGSVPMHLKIKFT